VKTIETDFLVLGSGIAGLWFSYRVAEAGKVTIVTKKSDTDSNTNYAQGGIAAAFGMDDSPDLHIQDTIRAGEGLCHEAVVRLVASDGPRLVKELSDVGVNFDTYTDSHGDRHFQLAREGGHLRHRIVHAKDYTGQEVEHGLVRAVKSHPNVSLLQDHFADELLMSKQGACRGCSMVSEADGTRSEVQAGCTLLATGGIGQVYAVTTNPPIATGDGIAMAFRAGARVANMEFIQFHPTALYGHRLDGRAFLITEAARGEGGLLKTRDGKTFMERYHELGNLAPRDVVARAVDSEMKKRNEDFVLLDMTHLDPERVRTRFPNIYQQCLKFGIDIVKQPIPVVPAAHYVCGGIETDAFGQTSIPGLFAAGECACSGLHGANRLASNSLLEALVMADRAAGEAMENGECRIVNSERSRTQGVEDSRNPVDSARTPEPLDPGTLSLAEELRSLMSRNAAIVRTDAGLAEAEERLQELARTLKQQVEQNPADIPTLQLRNMMTVAELIIRSARQRKESRGLHYNRDYPNRDDVHFRHDTVLMRPAVASGNT
jgi:L-aspartate oxidase